MQVTLPQVLLANRHLGRPATFEEYRSGGGYQALADTVGKRSPAEVLDMVLAADLRGRGGAGFPAGRKWQGIPADYVGPRYVRCPADLLCMARSDGYVMEHRLVVALAISRPLTRSECVHHINHDATDNRVENLMLFATNAQHKAFEHGAAIVPLWCGSCLSTTPAKCGACACRQVRSSPSATG